MTEMIIPEVVEKFENMGYLPADKDVAGNLEQQINEVWLTYFDSTIQAVEADPTYWEYPAREKSLSFFYTYLLELQPRYAFNVACLKQKNWYEPLKFKCLLQSEPKIKAYFSKLIEQGLDTGELASRAFLSNKYSQILFSAFVFCLDFWKNDTSEHFERSDIAVERAVHLAFDAMSPNFLDSSLELAQFLWKNKDNNNKK